MNNHPAAVHCTTPSEKPESTTTTSNALFPCPDPEGLYPVTGNCSSFYQCSEGKPYFAICPEGLHFNKLYDVCEHPCDAKCDPTINCSTRRKRSFREFPDKFVKIMAKIFPLNSQQQKKFKANSKFFKPKW
ncbi:probable endochitinase [Uloborus diversus]|uniref:probable endochitinase n=1 Tax=Uloborus diversus TaxID=327109 RepID=UPI00240A730D|nr:probable endochitinase [Uloborus diversus]